MLFSNLTTNKVKAEYEMWGLLNSLQGKMYTTSIKQKRKVDGNVSKCK